MLEPTTVHGPVLLPLRSDEEETPYELWYFAFGAQRWVAAFTGDVRDGEPVPLRIESACLFGHVLHSSKCDCGFQLDEALRVISRRRRGLVVYGVDQDARGLGIEAHFQIYVMRQQENLDTDAVYDRLKAPVDARNYEPVSAILRHLGLRRLVLLSNNPRRKRFLEEEGFEVQTEALEAPLSVHNMSTLMLEKEDLGYTWSFNTHGNWLAPLQAEVAGHPERRAAQLVEGTKQSLAVYHDERGWSVAHGLLAAAERAGQLATGAQAKAERVVYLTDLPRVDELPLYARLGAYFVVVPFADIPGWLRAAEAATGVRLQDWARQNRYTAPRPQWELAQADGPVHWYRQQERLRAVLIEPSAAGSAAYERALGVYERALAVLPEQQAPRILQIQRPQGTPAWFEVDLVKVAADALRAHGFTLTSVTGSQGGFLISPRVADGAT